MGRSLALHAFAVVVIAARYVMDVFQIYANGFILLSAFQVCEGLLWCRGV